MYVRMYVCMYVCMYACMYVRMWYHLTLNPKHSTLNPNFSLAYQRPNRRPVVGKETCGQQKDAGAQTFVTCQFVRHTP